MGVLEMTVSINLHLACQKEQKKTKTKGIQEPTNALALLRSPERGMEHGKTEVTSDMNSSRR